MIKLYGIKNCDTVKKAIKQLDAQNTAYEFIDLKTVILSDAQLKNWLAQCPDTLINKRSTTYRTIKSDWLTASSEKAQIKLIQKNQTVIKRPVIEAQDGVIIVGFDTDIYKEQV